MSAYVERIYIAPIGSTTWTDVTPYLKFGGLKISRNDIDNSDAGRSTQDGLMHRNRVAIKDRLDCSCRPLTDTESAIVFGLIEPEWVQVKYISPRTGTQVTKTMYSNNIPATYLLERDGSCYWEGIDFPLIER